MARVFVIFLVCFIFVSLFIGLYHLVRGSSKTETKRKSVVKSLTIRLVASILLLLLILVVAYFSSGGA